MTVLFLCRRRDLDRERLGYARAFRKRGIGVTWVGDHVPVNADLRRVLRSLPERPTLVIQAEGSPLLPAGLVQCEVPTVAFHIDTYLRPERRARWSLLFDYAVLFHPGFEGVFAAAGHPRPVVLPHAVDDVLFARSALERVFQVGWVGRLDGPMYETRRRLLPKLAEAFRMNEWWRPHSPEAMAEVYRRSKVVVNLARDDYPQDANLRVFEAMAAGALLVTRLPSELTSLGFREGVDFIGYRDERELFDLVRWADAAETERREVAESGRAKVLHEHTYDRRVETLLRVVRNDEGRLVAPARGWAAADVSHTYFDFWLGHSQLAAAFSEALRIARLDPRSGPSTVARLARAWVWRSHHIWARSRKAAVAREYLSETPTARGPEVLQT